MESAMRDNGDRSWVPPHGDRFRGQAGPMPGRVLRAIVATLSLVIGVALTFSIYGALRQNDALRTAREFDSLAEERVRSLAKTVTTSVEKVRATRALFDASEFVTREEFARFVTPLLADQTGVRALEWIPRVRASEIESYVRAAKDDGYEFRLRPIGVSRPAEAGTPTEHYPVFYVEPHDSNSVAFGIDLASDPVRLEALERARDTGLAAATDPIQLVQDRATNTNLLVFAPYYEGADGDPDVAQRREALAGLVLGVFSLPELLSDAIPMDDSGDIAVTLFYEGVMLTAGPCTDDGSQQLRSARAVSLEKSEIIELGGRRLEMRLAPTAGFLAARGTAWPPIALLAGIGLTILGAGYLFANMRAAEVRAALEQSEERYRTLVEHAPEGILLLSVERAGFVDVNENACRMFRRSRAEMLQSSLIDISAPIQPNGQPIAEAARTYLQRAVDGDTPVFMWLHRDADGNEFPCEVRLVLLPTRDDTLIRGSITDVTERVRSEERQTLMMRELDHRVKNNLATVLSLTEQSAANAQSAEELRTALVGRIHAIANLHRALARNQWGGIAISEVFGVTIAAYNGGERTDRVRLAGPAVIVPPDTSAALCMVVHELATNAVKYGALLAATGQVDILWREEEGGIRVEWTESGGPPVSEPGGSGYGTRLIRGLIEHELGGSVEIVFAPEGFRCTFFVPVKIKESAHTTASH